MRTIHTNVYQFSELSEAAQSVAIEQMRQCLDFQYDSVYEDAKHIGALLGFDDMEISFSGFWSQGDGASFNCGFEYKKGMRKAIEDYAPKDETLAGIAQRLQLAHKKAFYKLAGRISNIGHYCHAYTMQIADIHHADRGYDFDFETAESDILECARDFANWIYHQLENDYEYQTSDEYIRDLLIANEYEFYASGDKVQ